jgi:hypothetical protein
MSRSDFSGVIEGERLLMVQRHNTLTHALVYERARTRLLMRPPARGRLLPHLPLPAILRRP